MSEGGGSGGLQVRKPWTSSENRYDGPHKSPQSHQLPNNRRCFGKTLSEVFT